MNHMAIAVGISSSLSSFASPPPLKEVLFLQISQPATEHGFRLPWLPLSGSGRIYVASALYQWPRGRGVVLNQTFDQDEDRGDDEEEDDDDEEDDKNEHGGQNEDDEVTSSMMRAAEK